MFLCLLVLLVVIIVSVCFLCLPVLLVVIIVSVCSLFTGTVSCYCCSLTFYPLFCFLAFQIFNESCLVNAADRGIGYN